MPWTRLDIIIVRKLGVPFQSECAIGAVGEGGVRMLNEEVVTRGFITPEEIASVEARERAEVDGRAACQVARTQGARQVIVAVHHQPAQGALHKLWAKGPRGARPASPCSPSCQGPGYSIGPRRVRTFGSSGVPASAWIVDASMRRGEAAMGSVARVTEISAQSEVGLEDAIKLGVSRAHETLRGVRSAWIKEQSVTIENGNVTNYRVDMLVTFLLEE